MPQPDIYEIKAQGPKRGRVLFSHVADYLRYTPEEAQQDTHGSIWRIREIASIFSRMGYDVDALNWFNHAYQPKDIYDIVWDIDANLSFWQGRFGPDTLKLMHLTTSDPFYQNRAELQRVREVNLRRDGRCNPQRLHKYPERIRHSLEIADAALLLGTAHTLQSYPQHYHHKITLCGVTGSDLGPNIKSEEQFIPPEREFLWYFGSGAIHKGLDLVLEAFALMPHLKLNVVGGIRTEKDFVSLYQHELFELPNIQYHGKMQPHSSEFGQLIQRCFAFIAPSCSESISSATVTCLQLGLYPIISHDTGVLLPEAAGIYLGSLDVKSISKALDQIMAMSDAAIQTQIQKTQALAFQEFSRQTHAVQVEAFIRTEIARHQAKTSA